MWLHVVAVVANLCLTYHPPDHHDCHDKFHPQGCCPYSVGFAFRAWFDMAHALVDLGASCTALVGNSNNGIPGTALDVGGLNMF